MIMIEITHIKSCAIIDNILLGALCNMHFVPTFSVFNMDETSSKVL